jgi:hypothetical protein
MLKSNTLPGLRTQVFQVMALRTIATSPTDDERKNLVELGEQVEEVRMSSLKFFFANIGLSQQLLASRTAPTSHGDPQENDSFMIAELTVLLELGGIENVHKQSVNCHS